MIVEYRVLGPLEVLLDGEPVPLPSARGRTLLAALLLRPNRFVSVDELVELVWEGEPPDPERAHKTLHTVVMRLRQALGAANCVRTETGGYRAEVRPEQLDLSRFRDLVEQDELATALALWRGPVLANVSCDSLHRDEVLPLLEERLNALERRIEQDLTAGRSGELVGELQELTARHPLRDRFWGQLMLALYRSGQHAGALAVYRQVSEMLAEELGLDPAPALQRLHEQILRGESRKVPRQLPLALSTFVGREEFVQRLDAAGAKAVVIVGTGGVGKTSLAVHWAHRQLHRFPDGQIFVNLRGQDPARAMSSREALAFVLKGLGVATAPVELDEQVALYRSLMADRKLLLVLDNAASAEQVRPLLPAGESVLVVTSRGDLRGLALQDAELVRLPAFSEELGVRLLARVLGEQRVLAEAAAAKSLTRLCSGLPLALRIAAADLGLHAETTIAERVEQLSHDRLGELTVPGDPGAAVSVVFDESYSSLPEQARLLLRRLALLPGADFTADDAAVIAGLPAAGRTLDHLVGTHLVERRANNRYALHDLLRVYAAQRCDQDESAAAIERLHAFYRRMTEDARQLLFPDQHGQPPDEDVQLPGAPLTTTEEAFAWMSAEHANLLSTVFAATERGDHVAANAIAIVLGHFYYEVRDDTNWSALCDIRDRIAAESGADDLVAATFIAQSVYHYCQGDYDTARAKLLAVLRLADRLERRGFVATAHNNLASIERTCGALDKASHHFQQALLIHEELGSVEGQALVLLNLATIWFYVPDLPAGLRDLTRATELSKSPALLTHGQISLATTCIELGRFPDAEAHLDEYERLLRESGNARVDPLANAFRAEVHLARGEHDEAFDLVLDAMAESRSTVGQQEESECWHGLANAHKAAGSYVDSLEASLVFLEQTSRHDYVPGQIDAHITIARAARLLGDHPAAEHHLTEAQTLIDANEFGLREGVVRAEWAWLRLAQGKPSEALRHAEKSVALHRERSQHYREACSLLALADVHTALGDPAAAQTYALADKAFAECGAVRP